MSSSLVWKLIHLGENNESETIITSPFPVRSSPLQLTRKTWRCVSCKLTRVLAVLDLPQVNRGALLGQMNFKYITWEFYICRVSIRDGLCLRLKHHDILRCDYQHLTPRGTILSSRLSRVISFSSAGRLRGRVCCFQKHKDFWIMKWTFKIMLMRSCLFLLEWLIWCYLSNHKFKFRVKFTDNIAKRGNIFL